MHKTESEFTTVTSYIPVKAMLKVFSVAPNCLVKLSDFVPGITTSFVNHRVHFTSTIILSEIIAPLTSYFLPSVARVKLKQDRSCRQKSGVLRKVSGGACQLDG